jgi:hypothetical protein
MKTSTAILAQTNYLLGSGYLLMPWAFANTGYILSVVVLAIMMAISYLTGCMMIESISRAKCLLDLREQGYSRIKPDSLIEYDIAPDITKATKIVHSDLTSLFLGKIWSRVI